MLGDEGLQFVLLREPFFFEWFKPSPPIPRVDALCHRIQRSRSGRFLGAARTAHRTVRLTRASRRSPSSAVASDAGRAERQQVLPVRLVSSPFCQRPPCGQQDVDAQASPAPPLTMECHLHGTADSTRANASNGASSRPALSVQRHANTRYRRITGNGKNPLVVAHSNTSRPPLLELHHRHAGTKLSAESGPRRNRGIRWSTVSAGRPQYVHSLFSLRRSSRTSMGRRTFSPVSRLGANGGRRSAHSHRAIRTPFPDLHVRSRSTTHVSD